MIGTRVRTLTPAQARRVTLAAQGFRGDRGQGDRDHPVGLRDLQRVITRLGQFQIDTINVVERAQYLPAFSRLGGYDTALLDRAAYRAPRRLFEYWGHAASMIDITLEPALRWRMAAHADEAWGGILRLQRDHPDLVERVFAEVSEKGPLGAREIEQDERRRRDSWGWNWSAVKTACEYLLWAGRLTSARRNNQFERIYDLPERVVPAAVRDVPTPTPEEALATLVARAARALGIGTLRCLSDYFRTDQARTRAAVESLVAAGHLVPVRISGSNREWWMWHEATVPRQVSAAALVCPFDPLVFERTRLESLFDFVYRIEIYVPEAKRRYGYYVYPFLHDERFAARVDLKAHRSTGTLEVRSAWLEPDAEAAVVAPALAAELVKIASWLGLQSKISVARKGDLAVALRRSIG